jgi:polysaccharide export outer membrane protein
MRRLAYVLSGATLLSAAACGGPAQVRGDDVAAVIDLTDASKPIPPDHFPDPGAAQVAPGDVLELRVLGFPELSGSFLVAQDGRINLSLIGSVLAAGRTGDELDRDLTNAYSTYYRNIDVAVNVSTRAERFVYVLGEVGRPGRMDFRVGDRVLHAVAQGGGMTGSARENSVILLRRETDGRDHAYALDFGRIHERLAPKDIYLQPGDVVFVPKNRLKTATEVAAAILDVLSRGATTALVVDDLTDRTRSLTVAR